MGELIECRNCDAAYCKGCNIYILAKMLQKGKFDCLMDEEHLITIDPESLAEYLRRLGYEVKKCQH